MFFSPETVWHGLVRFLVLHGMVWFSSFPPPPQNGTVWFRSPKTVRFGMVWFSSDCDGWRISWVFLGLWIALYRWDGPRWLPILYRWDGLYSWWGGKGMIWDRDGVEHRGGEYNLPTPRVRAQWNNNRFRGNGWSLRIRISRAASSSSSDFFFNTILGGNNSSLKKENHFDPP